MLKLSQIPHGKVQTSKLIIYLIQFVFAFIAWLLALAVLTKTGTVSGAIKFYFFMAWMCLPAFIYLAVIPLIPQLQRFANPFITAGIDALYTVMWLAALAAVAVWTNNGIEDVSKGCASFKYGTQRKCQVSRASVIVAVIIFFLFFISAILSVIVAFQHHTLGPLDERPSISNPVFQDKMAKWGFTPVTRAGQTTDPDLETSPLHPPQDYNEKSLPPHIRTTYNLGSEEAHPGRPLSWGNVPLTAPAISQSQNPSAQQSPNDSPSSHYAVIPPHLQLFQVGNPFVPEPLHPNNGSRTAACYDPNTRGGEIRAAGYDLRPEMMMMTGGGEGGVGRAPYPGPASVHRGGWNSAYHTPLPVGMQPQGAGRNSWRDEVEGEGERAFTVRDV